MTIYSELHDTIQRGAASDEAMRWAESVLDDVIAGRHLIKAVRHPLGFLCLPVHRDGDEGVCIHLWATEWQSSQPSTTSLAHCHSWELLSRLLYGELSNQIVRVVDAPDAPTHRVFEVHSTAAGDEIRVTSRLVRHEVDATTSYHAGDPYHLPAGVFHQTLVPDAQPTATVALGLSRAGAVDLSLGGLHTPSHQVRREYCNRRDTVRAALSVRQAIAAQRERGISPAARPAVGR